MHLQRTSGTTLHNNHFTSIFLFTVSSSSSSSSPSSSLNFSQNQKIPSVSSKNVCLLRFLWHFAPTSLFFLRTDQILCRRTSFIKWSTEYTSGTCVQLKMIKCFDLLPLLAVNTPGAWTAFGQGAWHGFPRCGTAQMQWRVGAAMSRRCDDCCSPMLKSSKCNSPSPVAE